MPEVAMHQADSGVYGEELSPLKARGGALGGLPAPSAQDDRCAFRRPGQAPFSSDTKARNRLFARIQPCSPCRNGMHFFPRGRARDLASRYATLPHRLSLSLMCKAPCPLGIDEVQYLERCPKSQALDLHDDAIQITAKDRAPPSQGGLLPGL
jgi:hypothetical protein